MDNLAEYLAGNTAMQADGVLLRDVAYARIKDAIRHGALQPGEPLSEVRLSRMLGISRTPVREALQQLAQEGLVQVIPGRAVTVAAPSIEDSLNAIHVRLILEPAVVRLAADAMTTAEIEELRQTMVAMETAVEEEDRVAWSNADTRWHEIISMACPNRLLGELTLQIRNRVSFIAVDVKTSPERLSVCTAEHRAIVDAIATHNGAAAEAAMRHHINMLWESSVRKFRHV
ncbi:MAG: GntR family transcriptional regulator [Anaerolineales bacterium]|nr:GntR family transcriptional regulator [Anaerolineales bacterium]